MFSFSFFSIAGWGIDLDYCDIEWFALEMNRDHSVIFEIATKYCISDSFVDYEGYSVFFKGFLPPSGRGLSNLFTGSQTLAKFSRARFFFFNSSLKEYP